MKSDVGWEPYRTRTYEPFKSGNGSNETSFNAKPAGGRFIDAFFSEGSFTYWWSSSEDDDLNSFNRKLMSDGKIIQRPSYSNTMGLSIRCVKGE